MARPATKNSAAAANNSPRIVGVWTAPAIIKSAAKAQPQCANLPILPNSLGGTSAGLGHTIEGKRMALINMKAR